MKTRYQKPSIRKVKLVPSEAVLQACKTRGASGPAGGSCLAQNGICSASGS